MIKKFYNGSWGPSSGAFGSTTTGASGDSGKPLNFEKAITPLFIGAEYFNTIGNTHKQLSGSINTLHSLVPPGRATRQSYLSPNYNFIEHQYEDAKEQLSGIPVIGTSVDRQIAQQQAIGQQMADLDKQRILTVGQMVDTGRKEEMDLNYRSDMQEDEETEKKRQHENAVKESIQGQKDNAIAIEKDAKTKVLGEFHKLWQLKQERDKIKENALLRLNYERGLQDKLELEKDSYDSVLAQNFRNQFDSDMETFKDIEDFKEKYGIDLETWEKNYDSDEYKAAFNAYAKSKETDWEELKDKLTTEYYDQWFNKWSDVYYSKKGGKVQNSEKTARKSLSASELIMIENTKNLHNFVNQMNEKQTKIFLKLMSI